MSFILLLHFTGGCDFIALALIDSIISITTFKTKAAFWNLKYDGIVNSGKTATVMC